LRFFSQTRDGMYNSTNPSPNETVTIWPETIERVCERERKREREYVREKERKRVCERKKRE